jgi:hypothetical protein
VEDESISPRFWIPLHRDQCAFEGKLSNVIKDVVGARDKVVTLVEEERAVAREEGGSELKGRFSYRSRFDFSHGNGSFAGHELRPA